MNLSPFPPQKFFLQCGAEYSINNQNIRSAEKAGCLPAFFLKRYFSEAGIDDLAGNSGSCTAYGRSYPFNSRNGVG
jgi:hypothetical protein